MDRCIHSDYKLILALATSLLLLNLKLLLVGISRGFHLNRTMHLNGIICKYKVIIESV
jgi:hypothetical protein